MQRLAIKNTDSLAARCEYLSAVQEYWPEVLRSLHSDTFPVYQTCRRQNRRIAALETLAGLSTALKRGASQQINEFDQALRTWAESHDIRDSWISDAAIQSMHTWANGGTVATWMYLAEELVSSRFQPSFGYWIPHFTKWPEFKRSQDAVYRRERKKYRAQVGIFWGEGRPKLRQQAVWTVLWQRGRSPEAIRNKHFKMTGDKVSLANIQMRVHEFADAAGLTLRERKAGPRARI